MQAKRPGRWTVLERVDARTRICRCGSIFAAQLLITSLVRTFAPVARSLLSGLLTSAISREDERLSNVMEVFVRDTSVQTTQCCPWTAHHCPSLIGRVGLGAASILASLNQCHIALVLPFARDRKTLACHPLGHCVHSIMFSTVCLYKLSPSFPSAQASSNRRRRRK